MTMIEMGLVFLLGMALGIYKVYLGIQGIRQKRIFRGILRSGGRPVSAPLAMVSGMFDIAIGLVVAMFSVAMPLTILQSEWKSQVRVEWYRTIDSGDVAHLDALQRAHPELRDADHLTWGLGEALHANQLSVASWFLTQGAQVNGLNPAGETPLMGCLDSGGPRCSRNTIAFLVEHGANPNLANRQGFTPLLKSVDWGDPTVVDLLVSHGANVNQAGPLAETPLIRAARKHDRAMIVALRKAGADPHAKDTNGETAAGLDVNADPAMTSY